MGSSQSNPANQTSQDIPAPQPVMAKQVPSNIDVVMLDRIYSTYINPNSNLNELNLKLGREQGIKYAIFYPINHLQDQQESHQDYLESIYEGRVGTPPLFYTQPIHYLPQINNKYTVAIIQGNRQQIELEKKKQKLTLDILIIRYQVWVSIPNIIKRIRKQRLFTHLSIEWVNKLAENDQNKLDKLTRGEDISKSNILYQLLAKLRQIVEYAFGDAFGDAVRQENALNNRLTNVLTKIKYICETFKIVLFFNAKEHNRLPPLSTLFRSINLQMELEFYFYYDRRYAYRIPHSAMVLQKCLQLVINKKISLDNLIKYGDTLPIILDETYNRWKDTFNEAQQVLHQLPQLRDLDRIYQPNAIIFGNEIITRHLPELDRNI